MNAILIAAALTVSPSTFYSGLDEQKSVPASVFYSGLPEEPKQAKVEEEDEAPADPLRVVVYVDLSDVATLRQLLAECDRLPGLKVEYRSADQVPESGRRFKLPLAHYRTDAGWRFIEWRTADAFRKHWLDGNPDQRQKQESRITAARANPSANYRARSYAWHLTQGESASALRSHLASPRAEHHGISFPREWLARLSFTELVGAHSDAHDNRVDWSQVNRPAASESRGQVASVTPLRSTVLQYRRRSSSCPSGRCPYQ